MPDAALVQRAKRTSIERGPKYPLFSKVKSFD
jgi:hypothetical protein